MCGRFVDRSLLSASGLFCHCKPAHEWDVYAQFDLGTVHFGDNQDAFWRTRTRIPRQGGPDGVLFEHGNDVFGVYVGVVNGIFIFSYGASSAVGASAGSPLLTSANRAAVIAIPLGSTSSMPQDDELHDIAWECDVTEQVVSLYIDSKLVGRAGPAPGAPLDITQRGGGGFGKIGSAGYNANLVAGGSAAQWSWDSTVTAPLQMWTGRTSAGIKKKNLTMS